MRKGKVPEIPRLALLCLSGIVPGRPNERSFFFESLFLLNLLFLYVFLEFLIRRENRIKIMRVTHFINIQIGRYRMHK